MIKTSKYILCFGVCLSISIYQMFYELISSFFVYEILNNFVYQIIFSIFAYFLFRYWIIFLFRFIKKSITKKETENLTKNILIEILEIIDKTPKYIIVLISLYIPLKILTLSEVADMFLDTIFSIIVIFWFVNTFSKIFILLIRRILKDQAKVDATTLNWINLIIKIVVWVIWILLILMNIWVEITPLIASLWIGWLAIAFALQNILKDLFSSFSILISKPFKVWDFVELDQNSWTIKNISLKNTKIVAIWWEEILIPNSKIMDNTIKNMSSRKIRRKKLTIWVTYETPVKKLKRIPQIIEKIVTKFENVNYERTNLTNLWAYSIDFEIKYYLKNTDLDLYLDTNQEIIFEIIESFEKEWINIAYPTQVTYNQEIKGKKTE